jgi:hypothetical protein
VQQAGGRELAREAEGSAHGADSMGA